MVGGFEDASVFLAPAVRLSVSPIIRNQFRNYALLNHCGSNHGITTCDVTVDKIEIDSAYIMPIDSETLSESIPASN